ncbi:MAG: glycosyltransferase family 2 protein [Anaerolineales bacterium]|nr:glycosyltransferase family 2 protein [Anaerolineales bacterium]
MAEAELSIVILNYNTGDLLARCLDSIAAQAAAAETIVVDNASPDGSAELVRRRFPWARLAALPDNRGFAHGMNHGLGLAQTPLLLALNADTALLPDTLPPLLEAAERWPQGGLFGPAQYAPAAAQPPAPGPALASAFADPTLAREAGRLLLFSDAWQARLRRGPWAPPAGVPRAVDWLMGAALLIRRACLTTVGGFDTAQFMYGEDWDLCYRARRAGWQVVWVPAARILHTGNAAGEKTFGPGRQLRVMQANLHFHEKHFGRASRRVLAGLYGLNAAVRMLLTPRRAAYRDLAAAAWRAALARE